MNTSSVNGYQHIRYEMLQDSSGKTLPENKRFIATGFVHWPTQQNPSLSTASKRIYTAKVYQDKPYWNSSLISASCLIVPFLIFNHIFKIYLPSLPLSGVIGLSLFSYAPLAIAYHALRIAGVSLYIFIHAIYDMIRGKGVVKTLKSHFFALIKQWVISVWGMIRAPFYAIIFNVGHLITLVSPRNGMRFASQVEYEWNRRIPVHNGFSPFALVGHFEKYLKIEGGGDIDKLQPTSFYLLRCFQPIAEMRVIVDHSDPKKIVQRVEVWSEGGSIKGQIIDQRKDKVSCIGDFISVCGQLCSKKKNPIAAQ